MSAPPHALAIPVDGDDHQLGDRAAPITLVEYGDYECSYPAYAAPVVDKVRTELGTQLGFVFSQPAAARDPAAGAARSAGRRGGRPAGQIADAFPCLEGVSWSTVSTFG